MSSKKKNQRLSPNGNPEPVKKRKTNDESNSSADLGKHLAASSEKQLSEKLTAMKFMQRSVVKESQEKELLETKKQIAEAHWVVKYSTLPIEKPKIKVAYEPGYFSWGTADTHAAGGRKSFGHFNTTVENLEKQKKEDLAALEEQKAVDALNIKDEEMASHMSRKRNQDSLEE